MTTRWIDTAFVRGGTSKGLCFKAEDLPGGLVLPGDTTDATGVADSSIASQVRERDALLCEAMGSPDPYSRQLDGMGGGVSSLSKALIVARSERAGVDLDYTFAQVEIGEASVDYSGNCGNLSSAVVPFALAAGLIVADDGEQQFTLFNTNTDQLVSVRLTVEHGQAATEGGLDLPGVSGSGSPIDLVYPDSGGSRTSGVLPTGSPVDVLQVEDREFQVSLVDAAIPLVLVRAHEFGLTGAETPFEIDADTELMALLERVRRAGAVRMGLCEDEQSAPLAVPKITLIGAPRQTRLVDGSVLSAAASDLLVRPISMGQAHRAVPGTGAMCLAAAANLPGTVVSQEIGSARVGAGADNDAEAAPGVGAGAGAASVRLGTPSGVVTAGAVVDPGAHDSSPRVVETSLARTARVIMIGRVATRIVDRGGEGASAPVISR